MPDANASDPDVLARLRALLPADSPPAEDPLPDGLLSDGLPVDRVPPRRIGPPWAAPPDPAPPDPAAPARVHPAAGPMASGPAGSEQMSARLTGLGAFDPGRRGVKALAGVAVIVVVVAASLAWRARPRVDPVPAADTAAVSGTAPDPAGASGAAVDEASAAVGGAPRGGAAPAGGGSSAGGPTDQLVVVAVGGKVRRPGLVRLPPGARVADAVQAAGGATGGVDVVMLNPARKVVDGELILVGVTPPPGLPAPATTGTSPTGAAGPGGGPVNLNTATPAELDTLPGVGPVLAQRIVDHRERQGPFSAVGDLRKVEGIGTARYEQLKDLVTV